MSKKTLYISRRKDKNYWIDKIPLKFSIDTLNIIIKYVASDNEAINRGNLLNTKKLFDMIDERIYEEDCQLISRFVFIKKLLKNKIEKKIDNPQLLLEVSKGHKYLDIEENIIEELGDVRLSLGDARSITSMISDKLTYNFYFKNKDNIINLFRRIESGEYENYKDISKSLKKEMTNLLTEIRKVESSETTDSFFSLTESIFEAAVARVVKRAQSASTMLKTNVQALNHCLNGGYEAGRVYMYMGLSGGFKSATLLNMVIQIKQGNKNYKTKDPTKRPAVLYLTQENQEDESIARLFAMSVCDSTADEIKNYSSKEAYKAFKNCGMKLTKENNIDVIIMYRAPGTIDTADLYTIFEELEEQGIEIVALIHDYLEKIKAANPQGETRLDLGQALDELKALAIAKQIPVLTAIQLNREASKVIQAGIDCGKTDLARTLGLAHISESWGVVKNSDWICIIYRERLLSDNKLYLSFNRLKVRYGPDDSISYFNHPLKNNEFGLLEDIDLPKPLSRKQMHECLADCDDNVNTGRNGRTNGMERAVINSEEKKPVFSIDSLF